MNSPVDPALIQLVQQELKFLQDGVKNMSVEYEKERTKVQSELQNCASALKMLQERVKSWETGQLNIERWTRQTEKRVDDVEDRVGVVEDTMSKREGAHGGNRVYELFLNVLQKHQKVSFDSMHGVYLGCTEVAIFSMSQVFYHH